MSSPDQTLKEVEAYLQDHPKDANAWNTHGVLLATVKQFGPALRSLDHAIKLDETLHQAHTNRGRVLLSLGIDKAHEALKSFDTALKLKPNDLENYYGERGRRGSKLPRGFIRAERMILYSGSNV